MDNLLTLIDWKTLLGVAVATSIVVEALNRVTPKWLKPELLLFLVALILTLLRIPLEMSLKELATVQGFLFTLILTISFAILFYVYLGKWTVSSIFDLIQKKFKQNADK